MRKSSKANVKTVQGPRCLTKRSSERMNSTLNTYENDDDDDDNKKLFQMKENLMIKSQICGKRKTSLWVFILYTILNALLLLCLQLFFSISFHFVWNGFCFSMEGIAFGTIGDAFSSHASSVTDAVIVAVAQHHLHTCLRSHRSKFSVCARALFS